MSVVDIVACVLIALGTLQGLLRGLSGELAELLSLVAAFVFGLWFHQPLAAWMQDNTRLSDRPAQTLAFAMTVLTALIVMLCLRFVVRRVMKVVIEARFDRVGGAVSGFARTSVIVLILFVLFNIWPHAYLNRVFGDESLIGAWVRSRLSLLDVETEREAHGP